ncbi:MAG: methyltransferase [Candidatus Latescibacteria bacterium]|nr:methyltransferase [Candidatus Latescibacterota bacterium]NIM66398.1 methyltransferase [Candidatus Latescibacterota bacterium]NIO02877.1 methyltransferase [Candidatus Latescibacterota bacterium]NIO30012.1 methyltransferase [Candidatus Latescibacterota bacterium]NIO57627.1 methyltransferase [Candidatus Latescibacterota bacterium]
MDPVFSQYIFRLIFALVIGGLIGVERETKGKPAGMRTNMLMCLGSCLLMILSTEVARAGGSTADPGRIAAQVVTGIGFLGAGTIIRSRVSVAGLTTAATLWFVAALGLVIGHGDFLLAVVAAFLIILTLTALGRFERRLEVTQRLHFLRFRIEATRGAMQQFKSIISEHRVAPENISLERDANAILIDMEYIGPEAKHTSFVESVHALEGVEVLLDY